MGATVIDADDLAREVCAPGAPVLAAIREAFGPEILTSDGALDRRALARQVFVDPAARRRLEALTHPAILAALRVRLDTWRTQAAAGAVLTLVLPLLFEAGLESLVDKVLVVSAPEAVCVARAQQRAGLTRAEALQRLAAQWPMAKKVERADYVIETTGSLEETVARVRRLWPRLVAAAAGAHPTSAAR